VGEEFAAAMLLDAQLRNARKTVPLLVDVKLISSLGLFCVVETWLCKEVKID
jgi:hypothetical protein